MSTRIITFIALLIVGVLSAQSKSSVELKEAVDLFNQHKNTEAKVLFQKTFDSGNTNWLSYYYLSLMNATEALNNRNDLEKMKSLLDEAQMYQDKVNETEPNNAEVLLVQALINTGWVVYNPLANGMQMTKDIEYMYQKALLLAPNNPRVILQKASYNIGKAKYFGQDISPYCDELAKSIELFTTFKPESDLHPNWGLDRAKEMYSNCNK